MKALILSILLFFSTSLYGIEYPRYEKDSTGQTVVVLTIEQVQSLDNSTDLLLLFEKLNFQVLDYDSVLVKVIKDKEEIILVQSIQIKKLKESIIIKDNQLQKLKEIICLKDSTILNLDEQVKNGEERLSLTNKELNKTKTTLQIVSYSSVIAIIGLILTIITN